MTAASQVLNLFCCAVLVCSDASSLPALLYRSRNDSSIDSPSECNNAALSDNSPCEFSAAGKSIKSSSTSGRNRKSSTNEPLKQRSSSRSSTSNTGAPLRLTDSYWNNKFEAVFKRKTEGGSLRNSELGAIAVTEDGDWDSDMERVGDTDEYAYGQEEIDYYRGRRASDDTIDSSDDEHRLKGGVGLCGSPLEPLDDDSSSCDWSSSKNSGSTVAGQKVEVSTANWQLDDDNAADTAIATNTTKQTGHQQKQQHANTTATTATATAANHTHNDSAQMTADELMMKQMRIAFLCDSATPSVSDGLVASRRTSTSASTAHIAATKLKQQQPQQQHSRRRSSSASSSSTQAPADTSKGGTVWRHDVLLRALQSDASIDVSIDSSNNDDTDICSNRSGSSHSDSQQSITSTVTVAAGNGTRTTTVGIRAATDSRSADATKLHTGDIAKPPQQQQQQQQQPHSTAPAAGTLAAAADSTHCAKQQTVKLIQPLVSTITTQKHPVNAAAAVVQTNTVAVSVPKHAQPAENSRRTSNAAADATVIISSSSAVKPSAVRGGGKLWQCATDALQLSTSQHIATDRSIINSSSRRSSLQHQQQHPVTTATAAAAAAVAAAAHPKSYPCSPTRLSSISNVSSTSATVTAAATAMVSSNSLSTPTSPTGYIIKHPTIELPYNELKGIGKPASSLGIDPYKREQHLSENEFYTVFQCDRRAFYALPKWRQLSKKKAALLF
eukprot:19175-Heterococcus_DN1.PRE.1